MKLALAVLVLMVSGAAAQTPSEAAATACPITDFSKVNWNTALAACANVDSPTFCNSCICGVGVALAAGFEAAGAQINGQPITSLAASDPNAVNGILGQCQTTLGLQLVQSGAVSADAIAQCDVEAAGNACREQVTAGNVSVPAPAPSSGSTPVPVSQQPGAQLAALQAARSGSSGLRVAWALFGAVLAAVML